MKRKKSHADEGWQINKEVVSKIRVDFDDILCEVSMTLSQIEGAAN